MERFTLNKRVYEVKELNFEYLVMLDKNDVKVSNISGIAAINCFVAYCGDMTEKQASDEISAHVVSGGRLEDIVDVYAKALEESGFFRALMEQTAERQENVEEKNPETSKKSKRVKAGATEQDS